MAIMKKREMRKLSRRELKDRLRELRLEVAKQRASIRIGATVPSPGKIKEIRRTIARILTILGEKEKHG